MLTVPHPWRKRLAYDGELLGALTRIFVSTVLGFYKTRLKKEGAANGQSGAVVVVQRTSSDLKTNPHLHVIFLDGVYRELADEVVFRELARLSTREVGEVLERAVNRMTRHVRRRELRGEAECSRPGDDAETEDAGGLAALAASAVDGRSPPAGPEWRRKRGPMPPLVPQALAFDKPLCASLDGFTLHAATRAGALDATGREALCKYVLPPGGGPGAHHARPRRTGPHRPEEALLRRDGRGRHGPAVSALQAGRIGAPSSSAYRSLRRGPGAGEQAAPAHRAQASRNNRPRRRARRATPAAQTGGSRYRPWAELLKRCFSIDVLQCASCGGRMKLVALLTDLQQVRRFLRSIGEPTEPPPREPARGPPFWKSRVLRRAAHDDESVA